LQHRALRSWGTNNQHSVPDKIGLGNSTRSGQMCCHSVIPDTVIKHAWSRNVPHGKLELAAGRAQKGGRRFKFQPRNGHNRTKVQRVGLASQIRATTCRAPILLGSWSYTYRPRRVVGIVRLIAFTARGDGQKKQAQGRPRESLLPQPLTYFTSLRMMCTNRHCSQTFAGLSAIVRALPAPKHCTTFRCTARCLTHRETHFPIANFKAHSTDRQALDPRWAAIAGLAGAESHIWS